jgi:hypothetical protein
MLFSPIPCLCVLKVRAAVSASPCSELPADGMLSRNMAQVVQASQFTEAIPFHSMHRSLHNCSQRQPLQLLPITLQISSLLWPKIGDFPALESVLPNGIRHTSMLFVESMPTQHQQVVSRRPPLQVALLPANPPVLSNSLDAH